MAATEAILDFRLGGFYLFLIYKTPQCFLPSFESTGLLVQEKKRKTDFEDGSHGCHLFLIGKILAIFDLQATPMLPTKFQVNWPFGSGGEAKNRFSRWPPSWISDGKCFLAIFDLQVNWPRGVGGVGF